MKLTKYFLTMLIVTICISCFSVSSYANGLETYVDDEVISEYQIAADPDSTLSISGNSATYISSTFTTGGISITVEHTLEKHWGLWIWNDVVGSTDSRTVNRNNICLSTTKSGLDSGTYRVRATFTMTNSSGQTEVITIYSNEKTVS